MRSLCTPSLLTVREYLQIPQRIFPGFPTCCRRSHSPPSNFTPKHTPAHYAILHAPRLAVHSPRVGGWEGGGWGVGGAETSALEIRTAWSSG